MAVTSNSTFRSLNKFEDTIYTILKIFQAKAPIINNQPKFFQKIEPSSAQYKNLLLSSAIIWCKKRGCQSGCYRPEPKKGEKEPEPESLEKYNPCKRKTACDKYRTKDCKRKKPCGHDSCPKSPKKE
ncbi:uncharacterized protein LOC130896231 [Diorhabda carinulata]|uniref:uncharacterized protein LOC130896231 n=1 Tax=Diorhabda carinulata TaxID=1163345 RepID=UPI0025A170A0|nr:uncharacterized protein LOC130896231 [Diorhabda carinulata]